MQRTDLILLPGLLCDEALWASQIHALADVARPIVGRLTTSDSIGGLAESVLSRAPERFALAGFSMGGYVAFEIMRRAPQRVARLALLDTSARSDTPEQTAGRFALMKRLNGETFAEIVAEFTPRWIHPSRRDDHALTAAIAAMSSRIGSESFKRQLAAIMSRPDSRQDLGAIDCPVLVLCGEDDIVTPSNLHEEIADGIQSARLEIVPRCGHLSPLEMPEAVSASLRQWLTKGEEDQDV